MSWTYSLSPNPHPASPERLAEIFDNPGFGRYFTDHMVQAEWDRGDGWHDPQVVPYGPIGIEPGCNVLHYAQEVFEGLKVYRRADDSLWLFRPDMNATRYARSAERLSLPPLPDGEFERGITALLRQDSRWVPPGGMSLYLRPFMFAYQNTLGVHSAGRVLHLIVASPVGNYFVAGVKPVDIWVTREFNRAAVGGTGEAKCGGNYASSLIAQDDAEAHGCSQVLFLDAASRTYLEELGGMNVFLVTGDGELVTPELSGSILHGVTRDSILRLAPDLGLRATERKISIDELNEGMRDGTFTEAFACGTAAVVAPINRFCSDLGELPVPNPSGEITMQIRERLLGIQYGTIDDPYGWTRPVEA